MNSRSGLFQCFKRFLAWGVLLVTLFSCATIVSPTGGPKDETPPTIVKSEPENYSTNFKGDRLTMEFSEYIELKDMEKFLLISPPLSKDPDIRIKSRSLIVKLKDTLRSNTTYSFYFGDAVVDLTEKNPLKNFSFAFSTGAVIDSLGLAGKVADAYTRLPMKDVLVMLYRDFTDSVPMLKRPDYVCRTDDAGGFRFNSLASGKYRLLSLKDGNADYMYNLPTELIAFDDSLVEPFFIKPAETDTTKKLVTPADAGSMTMLNMFPEPDSIQRILKSKMITPHQLSIVFRYPSKNPEFIPLGMDSTFVWSQREMSSGRDTITCWMNKDLPDTLRLKVLENHQILDTLEIATLFKVKNLGKNKPQAADTTLKFFSSTARSSYIEWNSPYSITFANPLVSANTSGIRLIVGAKDTITPVVNFADSTHRKMVVNYPWKTEEDYKLIFPEKAFKDIYNQVNDSVKSSFKLRPKEEYGSFRVSVTLVNVPHPMIIQLLNENAAILKQQVIQKSQKVDFGYLTPGKYGLKAIYDRNGNGRWDSGIYLKRIQPERVDIHPKSFDVRGNWELEEEWNL